MPGVLQEMELNRDRNEGGRRKWKEEGNLQEASRPL
jgi:hypothetical protein